MKVICNHTGGIECNDCEHNKPHNSTYQSGNTKIPEPCTIKVHYCSCACDDLSGDKVQCYSIDS